MNLELGDGRGSLLLVGVVFVALVAAAGAVAADDQPTGEEILNDTRERYASAESVVGMAEMSINATADATANATVEFAAAGNESRVVVHTANATYRAGTNGSVAWYAGPNRTAVWDHDALEKRARERGADLEAVAPSEMVNRTAENVTAERLRTESVDGVEAHVVRIAHENESVDARTTLWIATDDSRLLRATVTNGSTTTTVDVRETRFNASVHSSTFDPPTDRTTITAVDRYDTFAATQANTTLSLPSLDAAFDGAAVTERTEGTLVAQQYTTDGENVTVVSTTIDRGFGANATTVTVGDHTANVTTARGVAVVYWQADGVTTAVTVDGTEDRAIALARQLAG